MSRYFIDRPILAWVIGLAIMLVGIIAIRTLPVAQYPAIGLPQISVSARYPGASAKTVEDSVTQVVEASMKNLDGLLYISSTSESAGLATVVLTFAAGTNADLAQVQVQNKLQSAAALLPQPVQQQGLTVAKSARNYMMVVGLYSPDGTAGNTDLGDYGNTVVADALSRVKGVGDVQVFGSPYAMRIWLDPNKLASYRVTPADIAAAVRAQNAQVSAGQLGGLPAASGAALNVTVSAQSPLQTPEQFGEILLRSGADGSMVRLRDVARIELGAERYDTIARLNGKPAVGMAVRMAAGANALDTARGVKARMEQLSASFPPGISWMVPFDTTPFVKISIQEVVLTLAEAIGLVFCVMFLFLQNWRATLIPTIAVPIVLLGTFAILSAFGYSINTLTLFGLVLAIGLLVDDAIVVVENVERLMAEEGLSPRDAAAESMREITGALVGITLVLSAVFVPMAFFSGSQGVIYRQFSVTLVAAMSLSLLVALILTPALCASLLRPPKAGHVASNPFFVWFNRNFDRVGRGYRSVLGKVLARSGRALLIYGALVLALGFLYVRLPGGFLPQEDQGSLNAQIVLPGGATQGRTLKVLEQLESHFLKDEKANVRNVFTVAGFNFGGTGQNAGTAFIQLKPWDDRRGKDQKAQAIAGRAMGVFSKIRDGMIFVLAPPAVPELGVSSGFDLQLQDVGGVGHEALMKARNQLLGMAAKDPALSFVRPNGQDDKPELRIDGDQARAGATGLTTADINSTLSAAWGGAYINDFIDRGRVKKVFMQADAPFRMRPEDLDAWQVRNKAGEMVPFSAIASAHWTSGSPRLERYNGLPSMNVQGAAAPGKSSSQAMAAMERLLAQMPVGIGYEWTGLSYQEKTAGAQGPLLYALSILAVFLLLAALYESWTIPLSVILILPLGIVGALLATTLRGLNNDIYFQVALLTTMGLSAKNAILIVEFAKDLHGRGLGLTEAVMEAVRIRLRPILMTSMAFVFGVFPLVVAHGAGSGSQNAIGTAVMGGVISATVLAIFFVPVFFVLIQSGSRRRQPPGEAGLNSTYKAAAQ